MTRRSRISIVLGIVVLVAGIPIGLRWLLWHWELNPVLEGRLEAEEEGCFACHHPYGQVEIPNPGSRWGTVPSLDGGNAMMYASSRDDLEGFIRSGAPKSWLENPKTRERLETQHIRMPAFGGRLSDGEVSALVAFAAAEGGLDLPGDEAAVRGRDLAIANGCVSCHGVEGSGGNANPGSLGGFVPGFAGGNFTDLVRNEEEFRDWVRWGTNHRLERNPVVAWFWRRQKLHMPAYDGILDDAQIGDLWAWVQAIRSAEGKGK